jgi:hypothetical protein
MKSFKTFYSEAKKSKPGHNATVLAKNISKVMSAVKKEEAEQIDEISASTLQSYVGKARDSKKAEMKNRTAAKNDMKKYGNMAMDKRAHDDASRKVVNRGTGISVANRKLNTYPTDKAKAKVMAKEEVELDEENNTHVYLNPLKGNADPKKVAVIKGRVTNKHLDDLAKKHNASREDFEWGNDKWNAGVTKEEAELDESKNLTDTKSDWRSDKSATAKNWSHNKLMKVAKHDRSAEKEIKRRIASKEYVFSKEEVELDENIKGWKHAASDISKMRAAQGKTVKLVSLKKDGTESKMHDATKMFRSEDEAQEHHDRVTKLNPKSKIAHNMYVDGKHIKTLG